MRRRRLPEHLKACFWDYRFHQLSWERDRDLVIARVLQHGDWEAIRWLRGSVTADELGKWILDREGRGLDPRRLRFWELVLQLPSRRVNRWMKVLQQTPWHQRAYRR